MAGGFGRGYGAATGGEGAEGFSGPRRLVCREANVGDAGDLQPAVSIPIDPRPISRVAEGREAGAAADGAGPAAVEHAGAGAKGRLALGHGVVSGAGDPGFTRYGFADGSAIVVFEGQWAIGVPVSRLEEAQRALLAEVPDVRPDMARFLPEDHIG